MVQLKNDDGFSLIETITAIVILGVIITFTSIILTKILYNPRVFYKDEAYSIINSELQRIKIEKEPLDTNYKNAAGNLLFERIVQDSGSYKRIELKVTTIKDTSNILTFFINKNNEDIKE